MTVDLGICALRGGCLVGVMDSRFRGNDGEVAGMLVVEMGRLGLLYLVG